MIRKYSLDDKNYNDDMKGFETELNEFLSTQLKTKLRIINKYLKKLVVEKQHIESYEVAESKSNYGGYVKKKEYSEYLSMHYRDRLMIFMENMSHEEVEKLVLDLEEKVASSEGVSLNRAKYIMEYISFAEDIVTNYYLDFKSRFQLMKKYCYNQIDNSEIEMVDE